MDLGFGQQNQQMGNQALEAVGMIAEMQENMLDAEIHKLECRNPIIDIKSGKIMR